ncbi:MAG: hypothetical protein ACKOJF_06610, partial [Planctomycetaceae bacterium]
AFNRGCYGCHGPVIQANSTGLLPILRAHASDRVVLDQLLNVNPLAPEFERAAALLRAGETSSPSAHSALPVAGDLKGHSARAGGGHG